MAGKVYRTPAARSDLIEIWLYIASDNEAAADRVLDRLESVLMMLLANPEAGRARPDLLPALRSFAIGSYVLFYRQRDDGIELVRALSGYRDIQPGDVF